MSGGRLPGERYGAPSAAAALGTPIRPQPAGTTTASPAPTRCYGQVKVASALGPFEIASYGAPRLERVVHALERRRQFRVVALQHRQHAVVANVIQPELGVHLRRDSRR